MTSIPASRSARAMTFAPRSWPSSPGFATRTRIFLSLMLESRLLVESVNVAQRVTDFAERGVGADGVDGRGHRVVARARGLLQLFERVRDGAVVAPRLRALQAFDLVVAHPLVDDEDGDFRLLALHRVLVDADDGLVAALDGLLVLVGRFLNLALREALLDG